MTLVHSHLTTANALRSFRAEGDGMIKSELIHRVADQRPHLYRRDIEKVVNAVLEEMRAALARQDGVELRGFGSFTVKVRSARPGRNPKTGSVVSVPKTAHTAFKTGREMHRRLNADFLP
jgi:integration host factor subunit beta